MVARSVRKVSPDCPRIPVHELADDLGVSENTVVRACKVGEIVATKLLGQWIIPRTERDRLLKIRPAPAALPPPSVVVDEPAAAPERKVLTWEKPRRGRPRKHPVGEIRR
jgi:hypothetical protein